MTTGPFIVSQCAEGVDGGKVNDERQRQNGEARGDDAID
jgi:hypothetical protein